MKFNNFVVRERQRVTCVLSGVSGNYAEQRIVFGPVGLTGVEQSYQGFTVLAEGPFPAGAAVELWLPRMSDGNKSASAFTDADYFFAATLLTAAGAANFTPAGCWTGGQIRVKSGAVSSTGFPISATAS